MMTPVSMGRGRNSVSAVSLESEYLGCVQPKEGCDRQLTTEDLRLPECSTAGPQGVHKKHSLMREAQLLSRIAFALNVSQRFFNGFSEIMTFRKS